MKKKIFGGIAVLAIAAMAAFNLNLNVENETSALSLANIEVLAYGEKLPDNWKQGMKTGTKKIENGYIERWWGRETVYLDISCCVSSSPSDACDDDQMDGRC